MNIILLILIMLQDTFSSSCLKTILAPGVQLTYFEAQYVLNNDCTAARIN